MITKKTVRELDEDFLRKFKYIYIKSDWYEGKRTIRGVIDIISIGYNSFFIRTADYEYHAKYQENNTITIEGIEVKKFVLSNDNFSKTVEVFFDEGRGEWDTYERCQRCN